MIKIDAVDEAIMATLRDDGRLGNREVARRLEISEGTVRQRLKKLQDAGAIRIGLVSDVNRLGFAVSAWVRVSVSPEHSEHALRTFSAYADVPYVAATAGRYNILVVLLATNQLELMRLVNAKIESCRGVTQVDVRIIAQTVKHDIYEVVVAAGDRPRPTKRAPS
jgi:Lrp/AsnC family transcriptional regulator, regulator for asnA, asnC and gidA